MENHGSYDYTTIICSFSPHPFPLTLPLLVLSLPSNSPSFCYHASYITLSLVPSRASLINPPQLVFYFHTLGIYVFIHLNINYIWEKIRGICPCEFGLWILMCFLFPFVCVCYSNNFILLHGWMKTHCIHFIHSSVDGPWLWFHSLAAAPRHMDTEVWTRDGKPHYMVLCLGLLWTSTLMSTVPAPVHSHLHRIGALSPHPYQDVWSSVFLVEAILTGLRCNPCVVWICCLLMAKYTENFLKYWLVICISSSDNCLFSSSAH